MAKSFKILVFINLLMVLSFSTPVAAQVMGKWKTIDDVSGQPKSVVEIFERGGKYFGKIVHLFPRPGREADPVCTKCDAEDPRFGQKIKGMEIVRSMRRDGEEISGGDILDPESGKVYRCKMWREGENLMVRGYLGPFFRTQTWLPNR